MRPFNRQGPCFPSGRQPTIGSLTSLISAANTRGMASGWPAAGLLVALPAAMMATRFPLGEIAMSTGRTIPGMAGAACGIFPSFITSNAVCTMASHGFGEP